MFYKLLTIQILNYLEKNNLLVSPQFRFRRDYTTQSVLLHLTDRIREGIENGLVTVSIQFDFRKVFDSIHHQYLLIDLRSLGCPANALCLIHSYITGRSKAVTDQDRNSTECEDLSSGVCQGSSSGPILFLTLINSLPKLLKFCKLGYLLFSDDLQL